MVVVAVRGWRVHWGICATRIDRLGPDLIGHMQCSIFNADNIALCMHFGIRDNQICTISRQQMQCTESCVCVWIPYYFLDTSSS